MSGHGRADPRWADVPACLRARGLRWTPQRRVLLEVLSGVDGHVTGSELVEGCRAIDPATTPSTVYRTLEVLEGLGLVSHSHGPGGRQEFHVGATADHAHLVCSSCGKRRELSRHEVQPIADDMLLRHAFEADLEHLTIEGRCADCRSRSA